MARADSILQAPLSAVSALNYRHFPPLSLSSNLENIYIPYMRPHTHTHTYMCVCMCKIGMGFLFCVIPLTRCDCYTFNVSIAVTITQITPKSTRAQNLHTWRIDCERGLRDKGWAGEATTTSIPPDQRRRISPMPNDTTKAAPDERAELKPYTRRILDALA